MPFKSILSFHPAVDKLPLVGLLLCLLFITNVRCKSFYFYFLCWVLLTVLELGTLLSRDFLERPSSVFICVSFLSAVHKLPLVVFFSSLLM